jgi:radical SAM protein with 4Fe4S-binding SPASM domain
MELGDVRQTPFDEIWKNNQILKKLRTLEYSGNCGGCQYKNKCGGCRARAAIYNGGDFMAAEPWCKFGGV